MPKQSPNIWFKAKTYGYGWTPSTWQGWLCVAVYVAYTTIPTMWLLSHGDILTTSQVVSYLVTMAVGTTALLLVSIKKGEPAHWRWGRHE